MSTLSTEQRRILQTMQIMAVVEEWGLRASEVIDLLALEGVSGRHLEKFRRGNAAFPVTPATDERMQHVLGIADALRTTYPHNRKMGSIWMLSRQKKLNDTIPLQRIAEEGLQGLIAVRAHLDCTYAWDQSGSSSSQ
ncbi:MAG: hypothetical protein KDJ38_10725 [Gammaproteobacteria bacterium]|nr:hypothetical protein [Gammaproteobacteria bacterium]